VSVRSAREGALLYRSQGCAPVNLMRCAAATNMQWRLWITIECHALNSLALGAPELPQALRRATFGFLPCAFKEQPRLAGRQGAAHEEPLALRALVLLQKS